MNARPPFRSIAFLAFFAAAATPASAGHAKIAQPPVAQIPPLPDIGTLQVSDEQEIVITGNREGIKDSVNSFVESLLVETDNGKVARWSDRICLNIVGTSPAQNAYLHARIARVASSFDIKILAGENCEPSTYIVFASEPDLFFEKLTETKPRFFGSISPARLNAFRASPEPVRWIAHSELRGAQGETPSGFKVDPTPGGKEDTASSTRISPSRLTGGSRMDLQAMLVLVDASKLQGISNRSLSAYLAMVVLGNLRPDHGNVRQTSILNIFGTPRSDHEVSSADLSDWDLAYLGSLYQGAWNMDAEQRSQHVKAAMARNLENRRLEDDSHRARAR